MNKKYIAIAIIVLVVGFFIWQSYAAKKSAAALPPPAPTPTPNPTPGTSTSPGSSLPAPVSVVDPVSKQDGDMITPVLITAPVATFAPGVSSATATNLAATVGGPLDGYPAGFIAYFNSLGPLNQQKVMEMQTGPTDAGVQLIDRIVSQNLWGSPSVTIDWNNLVAAWGLPVNGQFSSFGGRVTGKHIYAR